MLADLQVKLTGAVGSDACAVGHGEFVKVGSREDGV